MKLRWSIIAACPLVLAVALVTFQRKHVEVSDSTPRPARRPAAQAQPFSPTGSTKGQLATQGANLLDGSAALNERTRSSASRTPPPAIRDSLSPAEWERRAQAVERDANHELARLIPLLGLAPDQQDKVFQALAATSPSFVPGMLVDGAVLQTPSGNAQQSVAATLTDSQVSAYLQDDSDTKAWWSEYFDHVSAILDSGAPAVGSGTAAAASTSAATEPAIPAATTPATKAARAVTDDE